MSSYLKIGKEIFERIPVTKTPYWGSLILAALKQIPLIEPKEISDLRKIINSNNWNKANEQFSKIRNLTFKNSDKQKELYFLLAEKISKITYNQIETNAQFDSDSGYWIYELALELAQSSNSRIKIERINGILNLFEPANHSNNYFAIRTSQYFGDLKTKIFGSKEEEFVLLKNELPLNCTFTDLQAKNPKSNLYIESDMWPNGTFEFQYDVNFKNSKIGYYALLWDQEIEIIDEFYVTK